MRYSFSGHESFLCKAMWLKKGYDFIYAGNKFSDLDAVVKLGVGKNMVHSIKYWMKSFGLLIDDNLTPIANYIFNDKEGVDPYAEDNNTLWLLHFLLITNASASLYNLFFLDFQREKKEFDRDSLLLFIKRKCNVPEQKNVYNENTVKKDIRVLLQNYISPIKPSTYEEFSGLLINLELIKHYNGRYVFGRTFPKNIDYSIILFALVSISDGDKTISYDKLHMLSLAFCIPLDSFLEILRDLSDRYPTELSYTDNSGIRNVQFFHHLESIEILNRYYSRKNEI